LVDVQNLEPGFSGTQVQRVSGGILEPGWINTIAFPRAVKPSAVDEQARLSTASKIDTKGLAVGDRYIVRPEYNWAHYVPIADGQTLGVNLAGSGQASLFIDGRRLDGTWESDGINPPRFKDATGNTLYLCPGKTWFQVLNIDQTIVVTE